MPHWVWVVDTTTGHRMDVDRRSLRYGLEPLNDPRYPDLIGSMARPRRAKHFLGKDGKPAQYVHGESRFDDVDEQTADGEPGVGGDTEHADDSPAERKPAGKTRTKSPAGKPADTQGSE